MSLRSHLQHLRKLGRLSLVFGAVTLSIPVGMSRAAVADGTLDTTFNAGGAGANATIRAVDFTSDDKIYIAGDFTSYNGSVVKGLARLNSDGSLDTTFNSGDVGFESSAAAPAAPMVRSIDVAPDGDIYVAGYYTKYNGQALSHDNQIVRLNSDGSLDSGFTAPKLRSSNVATTSANVIRLINDVVIISGALDDVYSPASAPTPTHTMSGLIGLTTTGAIDTAFSGSGTPLNYVVNSSANAVVGAQDIRQVPGSTDLYLRGQFVKINTTSQPYMARIKNDGSLSTTFNRNGLPPTVGTNGPIEALAVQSDGKVIIGGSFYTLDGDPSRGLVRLAVDGTVDTSFTAPKIGTIPYSIEVDSYGRIYVAGFLSSAYSTANKKLARLNADGTLDTTFDLTATPRDHSLKLALSPAGKVYFYGAATAYGDTAVASIGRVNSSAPAPVAETTTSTVAETTTSTTATTVAGPNVGVVSGPPVPGTPLNVRAKIVGTTATVTWDAPTTGGFPASYTATATLVRKMPVNAASADGLSCTADAPALSCIIKGLALGSTYGFSVSAANSTGGSAAGVIASPIAVPIPKVVKPATLPATGSSADMWLLLAVATMLLASGTVIRRSRLS